MSLASFMTAPEHERVFQLTPNVHTADQHGPSNNEAIRSGGKK